jgi:DNA-directed RNA polymerase subunit A'
VRDTSDNIVQFEFGEDNTSPVKVSSSEDNEIDVDAIADRVLAAEFEDDGEEFAGVQTTNLSESADDRMDRDRPRSPIDVPEVGDD